LHAGGHRFDSDILHKVKRAKSQELGVKTIVVLASGLDKEDDKRRLLIVLVLDSCILVLTKEFIDILEDFREKEAF
jgi:hypothetical protein